MTELYRVNQDGTVAIDPEVSYYPMSSCPLKLKVQLHTVGGVHMTGIIHSKRETASYKGWRPLPSGVKNVE